MKIIFLVITALIAVTVFNFGAGAADDPDPIRNQQERADKNIGYGLLIDRSGSMLLEDAEDADIPGLYHARFEAAMEKAEKDFLHLYDLWYNVHHGDFDYSYYVLVMHFGADMVGPPPGEPVLEPVGLFSINCAYWRILCSINDAADPVICARAGITDLPGPYSWDTMTPLVQGMAKATDILEYYRNHGFYNLKHLYIYTDGRENYSEHYFDQDPWDECDGCLDDGPIWPNNWNYDCDPNDPTDACRDHKPFWDTPTCFDYQCCMAAQISNNLDAIHLEYIPGAPKSGTNYSNLDIERENNPSIIRQDYADRAADNKSPADRSGEDYKWLSSLSESTGGTVQAVTQMPSWPTLIIEKVHDALQGHYVELAIYIEHMDFQMGGFDLLLGYDASAMGFLDAKAGQLLLDCGWEHFTYRFGANGNCGNACPSGLIRLVGLAETNDGPNHPSCFAPPDTALHELARLRFYVTNDRTYECQYVPVYFFWGDCGDNAVSSIGGQTMYVNRIVFDFDYNTIWNEKYDGLFPEDARIPFVGAPDSCLNADTCDCPNSGTCKPPNIRLFNFVNGGIDIICADSIDARGDINLNGAANEIADAVVFTNYFIYGLEAFDVNQEGQIAATDVNADGMVLSVADLAYLIRVIVGDALPIPKLSPVTAKYDIRDGILSVDQQMGAAYIVIKGNANPVNLTDNMEMKYAYDSENDLTRVLLYSMEKGHIFKGEFLELDGTLIEIEMATYEGATVKLITDLLPTEFILHQNKPNPFNPITDMSFSLPVASDVILEFYNITGQKVATVAEDRFEAGTHTVRWDGSNYASGVYMYRITAGDFTDSKKMLLLK